jgi:hypothetical protein
LFGLNGKAISLSFPAKEFVKILELSLELIYNINKDKIKI